MTLWVTRVADRIEDAQPRSRRVEGADTEAPSLELPGVADARESLASVGAERRDRPPTSQQVLQLSLLFLESGRRQGADLQLVEHDRRRSSTLRAAANGNEPLAFDAVLQEPLKKNTKRVRVEDEHQRSSRRTSLPCSLGATASALGASAQRPARASHRFGPLPGRRRRMRSRQPAALRDPGRFRERFLSERGRLGVEIDGDLSHKILLHLHGQVYSSPSSDAARRNAAVLVLRRECGSRGAPSPSSSPFSPRPAPASAGDWAAARPRACPSSWVRTGSSATSTTRAPTRPGTTTGAASSGSSTTATATAIPTTSPTTRAGAPRR